MEARLEQHVADLDRTTRELSRSRSRIVEAEDDARRALESAVSRDVQPHLEALPQQLRRAREAVAHGAPDTGLDDLVDSTTSALESLRRLTRGVFPTQLGRAGLEPALRSLISRTQPAPVLRIDATAAGRRFPNRVEGAVYFCCAQAPPSALTSIGLSTGDEGLELEIQHGAGAAIDLQPVRDRVEAAGGSLVAGPDGLRCVFPLPADAE
jgi:signal transduction histidine kinase